MSPHPNYTGYAFEMAWAIQSCLILIPHDQLDCHINSRYLLFRKNKNWSKGTATGSLKDGENQFILEIASLLATWGLPSSSGRFFAYLLLRKAPIGLDEVAVDLEMSKAGAWNAARLLERYGHVRRYGTSGSKRALYAVSDNFTSPAVAQTALLEDFEKLLKNFAETIAAGEVADQLRARAEFLFLLRSSMRMAIEEWNSRQSRDQKKVGAANASFSIRQMGRRKGL